MILKNTIKTFIFCLLVACSMPGFALKEDANKSIYFESDSIFYQNQKNTIQYLGHVHGQQGSTEIFADKMTIFYNNNRKISKILAFGKPAAYKTIMSPKNKLVQAYADRIIYHPVTGIVELKNNAKITQEQNAFSGDLIVIDMKRQTVASHPLHRGLTKIVLEPLDKLKDKFQ